MKFKIIILTLTFSIFILALEIGHDLQKNIFKFGYDISYKYGGQLCYSIGRCYIVVKFQLLNLNDISIVFRKC